MIMAINMRKMQETTMKKGMTLMKWRLRKAKMMTKMEKMRKMMEMRRKMKVKTGI